VFHERACAFVSVRWTRGRRQWDVTRVGTLYTPWIRAGVARPREPSLAIPVEGPGGTLRIGVRVVTVSPVSQPARRAFSLGPIAYSSPLPRLSDLSIGMETVIRVSFLLRVFSLHDRHSLEICSSSSDYATDLSLPRPPIISSAVFASPAKIGIALETRKGLACRGIREKREKDASRIKAFQLSSIGRWNYTRRSRSRLKRNGEGGREKRTRPGKASPSRGERDTKPI